jgi:hypothetical protein
LLQASISEPPILHAMLALSAVHEVAALGVAPDDVVHDPAKELGQFSLKQYGKALHQLQPQSGPMDQTAIHVAIIACVLFIYIDFLRGHYQAGCTHLHHGLRLLPELKDFAVPMCGPVSAQTTLTTNWIVEPLLRLYIQANLLWQLPEPLAPAFRAATYVRLPVRFTTLLQARWYLDLLLSRTLSLSMAIKESTLALEKPDRPAPQNHESTHLIHQLHTWRAALSSTRTALQPNLTLRDELTLIVLDGLYSITYIATQTLHTTSELKYDAYTPHFLTALQSTISLYSINRRPGARRAILGQWADAVRSEPTIDIGWQPQLFFTATKCRHRRIRHQAVRLLRCSAHKEGMWDSELVTAMAEEIISLEERDFFSAPSPSPSSPTTTPHPSNNSHNNNNNNTHDSQTNPTIKAEWQAFYDTWHYMAVPTARDLAQTALLPEAYRLTKIIKELPRDPTDVLTLTYRLRDDPTTTALNDDDVPGTSRLQRSVYDLRTKTWTREVIG